MMYENYLGNKTAWKILRILAEAPGKSVSREELKRFSKAGNFALSNSMNELKINKIILEKKIGKKYLYWLNVTNPETKLLTALFNKESESLKAMYPSIIIYLAKIVDNILKTGAKKIILFGSRAKGLAREDSDFDICVIFEKRTANLKILLSKLPDNIQTHDFEEKEFEELRKKKDMLVEEIIRDGIEII